MEKNSIVASSRLLILSLTLLLSPLGHAVMPSSPEMGSDFTRLPNGQELTSIKVSGASLYLAKGGGQSFSSANQTSYEKLVRDSQADVDYPVQWVLMDLDAHRVLRQSASANRKIFGASVAKVFTASTLLDKQAGTLSAAQMQLFANMLVVSSNTAWVELQKQIGGGNADQGRAAIEAFTQRMGYLRTHGFQGYLGKLHGNELTAAELVELLHDTYKARFPGAETFWKMMHFCRTGASRGRKYLPATQFVGGKTGTYDGTTQDPETGSITNPDGSAYKVRVRNHVLVFNKAGHEYAIAILANTGSDETAALLAGGLYREL